MEARLMQKLSSHPNLVTFYRSVPLLSLDYPEGTLMSGSTSDVNSLVVLRTSLKCSLFYSVQQQQSEYCSLRSLVEYA